MKVKKAKEKILRRIGIILHSDASKVKEVLSVDGYNFLFVNSSTTEIPSRKDQLKKRMVLGFASATQLINNLKKCARPPLLFEVPTTARHVELNHKVVYLDADPQPNGIIRFRPVSERNLLKLVSYKYKYSKKYAPCIEKANVIRYGNDSELSHYLNNFLATLPQYMSEPVIIALVSAIESNNYKAFDDFVSNNRLVTDENKEEYTDFVNYMTSIQKHVEKYIKKGVVPSNKDVKISLARLRLFRMYYDQEKLKGYMDDESNVNLCKG